MGQGMIKKIAILTPFLALILVLLVNCAPTTPAPPSAPASPPTVTDQPSLSADEVCALCWSRLPSELPEEYQRSQFNQNTREATYQGDGQWEFIVSGLVEGKEPVSTEIVEKASDYWVEQRSQKVTTRDLKLTAVFYEKLKVFEIAGIEESKEQLDTKVTETPVPMEFRLDFINGWRRGRNYRFEGYVENIGQTPLKGIQVEIVSFGEDDNFLDSQIIPLEPEIIEPGVYGHFMLDVYLQGMYLASYDYQFLSSANKTFSLLSEDPEVWILEHKSGYTY